jgi:hypothetical protein
MLFSSVIYDQGAIEELRNQRIVSGDKGPPMSLPEKHGKRVTTVHNLVAHQEAFAT